MEGRSRRQQILPSAASSANAADGAKIEPNSMPPWSLTLGRSEEAGNEAFRTFGSAVRQIARSFGL
jgi:hypothetical protein